MVALCGLRFAPNHNQQLKSVLLSGDGVTGKAHFLITAGRALCKMFSDSDDILCSWW